MRDVLGGAKAIVASTKKVGGPGARLDIPITHINASYVRSHFDAMEVGIADAVTVLADTAAMADAAATVVANSVDLPGHPRVGRVRACDLAPDSDLGERLVTQSVEELTPGEIREALEVGVRVAESLCGSGLVRAAALNLQGETRIVVPVETGLAPSPSAATRAGSPVHA